MATEFKLPDVGENIEKASVVRVLVAAGDTIAKNQGILEIETDKATLEVPSNVAGVVAAVKVKAGDEVRIGQVIATIDADGKGAPAGKPAAKKGDAPRKDKGDEKPAAGEETEPRTPAAAETIPKPAAATPTAPQSHPGALPLPDRTVAAAPSVRRLAREIGVAIGEVRGTGPGERVTMADVKAHAKARLQGGASGGGGGLPAAPPLPDFGQWGEIDRQPLSNIRKLISQRLGYAWIAIPHVHQHDKADVTDLEAMRGQTNARAEKSGGTKLTMTAILLKVVASLLRRYPRFNASYDSERQELIVKKYIAIGVAVDTPRGLVVPVIRDVDHKSMRELAAELGEAAARARDGKLTPDDMKGGTFTISNLGGIGGTSFNPIVNWPEVAILGVARTRKEVALDGGKPVERMIMPLCLAYDHRVIDGADGARFIGDLTQVLTDPHQLLFEY
jgi:pyruvate dehydrogenase E2 component (dihydrolipoamide acetyltransferase)